MRLIRVKIIKADTCGGLLDGLEIGFRSSMTPLGAMSPFCLIGPNGTGKSQFLQVIAEIFQSAIHIVLPKEERREGNPRMEYEIEYHISPSWSEPPVHVKLTQIAEGSRRPSFKVFRKQDLDWVECQVDSDLARSLFPRKVIGYTSGDNETLSLPFFQSRAGYAKEVRESALEEQSGATLHDTRLMMIDYSTHIEVLVANLLVSSEDQREQLLRDIRLRELHSFRCILQLNGSGAREVKLTQELEQYVEWLKSCATCYDYEPRTKTHVLDFFVTDETRKAFSFFWPRAVDLFGTFHKLAMLNDLAIPKSARIRFDRNVRARRFATKLPEPQEEEKVFRFEQVKFYPLSASRIVDYVSLSDGEHQLAQMLGIMGMVSAPGVLFLLDEAESHFNPQWRVKFLSRLLDLPTSEGCRSDPGAAVSLQECLLTTHAPFVPSDMPRENVLIFEKGEDGRVSVRRPDIETFGTTFDDILDECFGVRPPISGRPRDAIETLRGSEDPDEIRRGLRKLGNSIEKAYLVDRLDELNNRGNE